MNSNPYESPRQFAPSWLADQDSDGLWRDGDLLVARLIHPRFPHRCLKTNEYYDGPPTQFDADWIPNRLVWTLLFGAIGRAMAKATLGHTVSLQIPVSFAWLAGRKRASRIGWSLVIGGGCCFVLAVVGYVLAMASDAITYKTVWPIFLVLACPLVSLAGLAYLALCHRPILRVRRMTNEYVWIATVNLQYLASLPAWPG